MSIEKSLQKILSRKIELENILSSGNLSSDDVISFSTELSEITPVAEQANLVSKLKENLHDTQVIIDDETGEAVIKYYKDEDGNVTGDIPHNTVFMDNLGKSFKYSEIQANLQANWLALRKQMLIASLRDMPDGVVVHKDENRIFSPKLRYILYQRQGGKTFSTNETIELVDLYNSNKYQIDQKVILLPFFNNVVKIFMDRIYLLTKYILFNHHHS